MWEGRPADGFRVAPQDVFAIPFSIFWLLVVLAANLLVFSGEATKVEPVAYVILPSMVLMGLYFVGGRFVTDRYARRRTNYVLTSQRALIESGAFRKTRRSVSLAALPEIRFRSSRNGRGTIQFGSSQFSMIPATWPGSSQFSPPAFDYIDDAERIYEVALSAQREAQAR